MVKIIIIMAGGFGFVLGHFSSILCLEKLDSKQRFFFFSCLTFCLAFQGPEFLDVTQISRVFTIGCFGWVYGYSMV